MRTRLLGLLRKEIIQFFRDRPVLVLILYFYTACVVLCTYALSFEVKNVPLAVVDQDRSVASRHLVERFDLSEAFDVASWAQTPGAAVRRLETGDAGMALIIPSGFERDYQTRIRPRVQILLDGTNSNSAATARQYALAIIRRFESERPSLGRRSDRSATAIPVTRVWYNPDQTTTPFMVLSMIALAGMLVGVMHPAATIVREKEQGTIEQLLVTPIRTGELFIAKTTPTMIMGLLSVFPSLLIVAWFDVPFRGSLLIFLPLTAAFLLSAIALGVLVAAVCRTMQQALLLSFFGLFPIMFLSGSLTPVESMPPFLQTLSLGSPLRYYMEIILSVFLKGAGWRELWDEAAMLLLIGGALFSISLAVFRRRIV